MTDPRDFDRRMDQRMEMERRMGSPSPWGWIAGARVHHRHPGAGVRGRREHQDRPQRRHSPRHHRHGAQNRAAGHRRPAGGGARDHRPRRATAPVAQTHKRSSPLQRPGLKAGALSFFLRSRASARCSRQAEHDQLIGYAAAARRQRAADEIRIRADHRGAETVPPRRHGRERAPAVGVGIVGLGFGKGVRWAAARRRAPGSVPCRAWPATPLRGVGSGAADAQLFVAGS